MRKLIVFFLATLLVLAFSSIAYADGPGGWDDPEAQDALSDPDCQVCHGPVEDGGVVGITHESTAPISLTLRNTIKFKSKYALNIFKAERWNEHGLPLLDLGDLVPSTDPWEVSGSGHFWTRVYSNAPYYETYSWTDFTDGPNVVPKERMSLRVTDNAVQVGVPNGGHHPAAGPGGPHAQTNPSNWERVDVDVTLQWNDPVGTYTNTLDIVVSQI